MSMSWSDSAALASDMEARDRCVIEIRQYAIFGTSDQAADFYADGIVCEKAQVMCDDELSSDAWDDLVAAVKAAVQ